MSDDEGPDLDEMDTEERLALGRACLDRCWPADGPPVEEKVDEDGNLIRRGRLPSSNRRFELIARLDEDDEPEIQADLGNIDVFVEVDNRIDVYIHLDFEPEEPGEHRTQVGPDLHVYDTDEDYRARMEAAVKRFGDAFVTRCIAYCREFEHWGLELKAGWIKVDMFADLTWDDEEWAEVSPNALAAVQLLDGIASVVEEVAPETFVACKYCGARFDAGLADGCPKCGAPIG